jgi:hypothetical protein
VCLKFCAPRSISGSTGNFRLSGANSWSSRNWQFAQTVAVPLPFDRIRHAPLLPRWDWCCAIEGSMSANSVVIFAKFFERPFEISACPERHLIQEFATNG